MSKKLTTTVDDDLHARLNQQIGRQGISSLLSGLARDHFAAMDLEDGYKSMAADEEQEREALEWIESVIEDIDPDCVQPSVPE